MRRFILPFLAVVLMTACSSPAARLEVGDGPLVYVPMGNSLMFSPSASAVIDRYPAMLAEDFGVEVEVRDHTRPAQRADDFLDRLQNDDGLRADLAEADVVTFLIPNDEWAAPLMTFVLTADQDPASCGGEDGEQCLRDMVSDYTLLVDRIFAELMTIVDTSEQVVLVQDIYQFHTEMRTESTQIINPYWREAQVHVREVAEAHGVAVAGVWDDFMGGEGEIPDLTEAGLVEADGIHPTSAGAARIADLYHELGYTLSD